MLKYFRNRKTIGYLVGSFMLMLVIVAFILLYIPDFLGPAAGGGTGGLRDEIAQVEGISISGQDFYNRYRMQMQVYQAQLGNQFNPALMRQLGLPDNVLNGLIQEVLISVEAKNQGLRVTDEEIRDAIVRHPSFQTNGQFIGREAYLQILASNNPPRSPAQFEDQIRQDLVGRKLQNLVTDGVVAGSAEVEEAYRRRNEKAELAYIFVPKSQFEGEVELSDEDITAHYEANKDSYQLPTQRKLSYVTILPQAFQTSVTVADREIERYYNQNLFQYETPEQVGASHILFKTAEADEDEVRGRAEAVLQQVKAGGDFAELARQHSEDTSAEQGGDLGFFGRGEMVPEFEQAAFALGQGEVSDLVRSTYGYHIIKVTSRQAPLTRPLDSVREEIKNLLSLEKAGTLMEEAIGYAVDFFRDQPSMEAFVERYQRLSLNETAFFGRQDSIPQLGGSPEAQRLAFELEVGQVSPPIRIGGGYVFFQVLEENAPRIPPLDEIQEQVRRGLLDERAVAIAENRATELAGTLKQGADAARAAESAGFALENLEDFQRGGTLPQVGSSVAATDAVFSLPLETFSDPIRTDSGYVLLRVAGRSGFSPEVFATEKDRFTEQFINEKRQRTWSAYLQGLQRRYPVQRNRELLQQIVG
jgi:peptidyl-prolyl cis-trans isomerase D